MSLNSVHAKRIFLSRINLIWAVQSHFKKYSVSDLTQIKTINLAIPSHMRGVSRSSRTLGTGCGGRESSADERCWRGRRSRVVL